MYLLDFVIEYLHAPIHGKEEHTEQVYIIMSKNQLFIVYNDTVLQF